MDDFIPNDGANYDPSGVIPEDQEKDDREHKSRASASYPILDDLITSYEKSIADADSVSRLNLYVTAESTPQQAQIMIAANAMFVQKENERLELIRNFKAAGKP